MDLLVAGCGYVGLAAARRWRNKGFRAYGLRRSSAGLEAVRAAGVEPIQADLLDPHSLSRLPSCDFALLAQSAGRGESGEYRKTHLEGTRNFVAEARRMGIKKLVVISSTTVFGTDDGSWVDETTATGGHASAELRVRAEALLGAERSALEGGAGGMVLRLAGIYGPGRSAADRIRRGAVREFAPGDYMNRIRLEDIVAAIELLFAKGREGEIYLGSDDAPATQKEFYTWLYERMKLPVPSALLGTPQVAVTGKRCSNRKIRALGLELRYPGYREGYQDLL